MNSIIWNDDFDSGHFATEDPRVFVLLDREPYATMPDGCGYPPIVGIDYGYGSFDVEVIDPCWRGGCSCDGGRKGEAWARAIKHFGRNDANVERFARIFLGAERVETVSCTVGQGGSYYLVAVRDESDTGFLEAWQAYLDGEVYSVSIAVLRDRLTHDDPADLDEAEIVETVGGFYGARWAALVGEEMARYMDLPEFLPMSV